VIEVFLNASTGKSRIRVETGCMDHIGTWVCQLGTPPIVLLIADATVAELYADRAQASLKAAGLRAELHTFPPGDGSKSLTELNAIYDRLADIRLARDGFLIALGGGVVSDLTGFAAATWMRGVRYVTCPTTLESAVDACVGGKTGINHPAGKNLIGAFHHADLVAIDPGCLATLPQRDLAAGLAESIKHALIADARLVDWHEVHHDAIQDAAPEVMAELIERNLRIKIAVVEADEREHGRRALLNFGHTVGHAIEQWAGYELRHGEAVALGMVAAAEISRALGLLSAAEVARIRGLIAAFGLPIVAPRPLEVDAICGLTHGDKKVRGGKRRWVLLDGIGHATIRDDVSPATIRDAIVSLVP